MARHDLYITTPDGERLKVCTDKSGEAASPLVKVLWKIVSTPDLVMAQTTLETGEAIEVNVKSAQQSSAFLVFPLTQTFRYRQEGVPVDTIGSRQFQFAFVPQLNMQLQLQKGTHALLTLQFTRRMLKRWMPEPIIGDMLDHMAAQRPALINARPMELTPAMAAVLDELKYNLRSMLLLESRALDLLRLTLEEVSPRTLAYPPVLSDADITRLRKIREYIDSELDPAVTLDTLASFGGLSKSKLTSGFKAFFHTTVFEYLRSQLLHRARKQLLETTADIKVIARRAGYRHVSNFSAAFREQFRCTPSSLRRG